MKQCITTILAGVLAATTPAFAVELGVNQRTIPAESIAESTAESTENRYLQLIPEDKGLDPAWVKSS